MFLNRPIAEGAGLTLLKSTCMATRLESRALHSVVEQDPLPLSTSLLASASSEVRVAELLLRVVILESIATSLEPDDWMSV